MVCINLDKAGKNEGKRESFFLVSWKGTGFFYFPIRIFKTPVFRIGTATHLGYWTKAMICVEACMGAEQAGQRASLGVPCHLLKHSHVGRVILDRLYECIQCTIPTQLIDLVAEPCGEWLAWQETCGWHGIGMGGVVPTTLRAPWANCTGGLQIIRTSTYRTSFRGLVPVSQGACLSISSIRVRRFVWKRGYGEIWEERRVYTTFL